MFLTCVFTVTAVREMVLSRLPAGLGVVGDLVALVGPSDFCEVRGDAAEEAMV